MAKDSVAGHTWAPPPGVCPALISASEVRGTHTGKAVRIVSKAWVLDYEFTPCGRCRSGSARNVWHIRGPRTAHLYPPDTAYWEDTRAEAGLRHSAWMTFAGGEYANLGRLIHPKHRCARFKDIDGEIGRILLQAAALGQRKGEAGYWEGQALLSSALGVLLDAAKGEGGDWLAGGVARGAAKGLAERVQRYLRERLAGKIALEDVAHHARVSVSTLSHRYREETGETPMQTLASLRVAHAKALLGRGLPLKAIAPRLGFSDAFHLSRTFKSLVGVSPREYAKREAFGTHAAPNHCRRPL